MAVLSDFWCCDMKNNSSYTAPLCSITSPLKPHGPYPHVMVGSCSHFLHNPKCFSCWLNLPHSIPEFPHKYIHIYIYHHEDVKLMACILGPGWTNQVDMNLPNLLVPGQRSPCRWGFLSVLSSGILQKPPDPGHSRTKPGFSFGPLGICYVHKILKEGVTKIWSNSWDTHLKLLLPR